MKSHFIDIDVLISTKSMVWIVDKQNPNIPILKISTSDFNLIKNGIYKSQNNKVEYNGQVYWLPDSLSNKLKVKLKINNTDLSNIGISMQEFLNKDIIDNIDFEIKMENIIHLKNKPDDIYIICSRQTKKGYQSIISNLEEKLKSEGIIIKNFYYISETFYNQKSDEIRYKKIRLLLQHLVGYKTDVNKFIDEEITRYDTIHFYDSQYDTIGISNDVNPILRSILKMTDDGLKSVIKEDISEYNPILMVNQITDNEFNKKITKKVTIDYSNLIRTFEGFELFETTHFGKKNYTRINDEVFERETGQLSADDEYFEEEGEWNIEFIEKNWENFTKFELDEISKFFNQYLHDSTRQVIHNDYHYNYNYISAPGEPDKITNGIIIVSNNVNNGSPRRDWNWTGTNLFIIKLKDEWYYLSKWTDTNKYKCDQFDGLIELLNDIFPGH